MKYAAIRTSKAQESSSLQQTAVALAPRTDKASRWGGSRYSGIPRLEMLHLLVGHLQAQGWRPGQACKHGHVAMRTRLRGATVKKTTRKELKKNNARPTILETECSL